MCCNEMKIADSAGSVIVVLESRVTLHISETHALNNLAPTNDECPTVPDLPLKF